MENRSDVAEHLLLHIFRDSDPCEASHCVGKCRLISLPHGALSRFLAVSEVPEGIEAGQAKGGKPRGRATH